MMLVCHSAVLGETATTHCKLSLAGTTEGAPASCPIDGIVQITSLHNGNRWHVVQISASDVDEQPHPLSLSVVRLGKRRCAAVVISPRADVAQFELVVMTHLRPGVSMAQPSVSRWWLGSIIAKYEDILL